MYSISLQIDGNICSQLYNNFLLKLAPPYLCLGVISEKNIGFGNGYGNKN